MEYEQIWNKLLNNGEKVEYQFSIGNTYTTVGLIIWGIVALFFIFANFWIGALLFVAVAFYHKFYLPAANAYAFTNKRVLIHRGWLSTHTISVDYSKITDIHVAEPFFDKMISHTGHIAIITAGSTRDQIILKNIESPYEVKKKLDSLKDA
jgi:uncharacterized membrane protein YdbT with pleckstrin-like domain